ncbi:MAG: hypothetical protein Q9184_000285 [Pyrenodesmia sp. 2 TL-2023]
MSPSKARREVVTLRFKDKSRYWRAVCGRDLRERLETFIKLNLEHACEPTVLFLCLVNQLKAFLMPNFDQNETRKVEDDWIQQVLQVQKMVQPELDPHSRCEMKLENLLEDRFRRLREVLEKLHKEMSTQLEERDALSLHTARLVAKHLQDKIASLQGEIQRQKGEIQRQRDEIRRLQVESDRQLRILDAVLGHKQRINGTIGQGDGAWLEPYQTITETTTEASRDYPPYGTERMDFSTLSSASTSAPDSGAAMTTTLPESFLPDFHEDSDDCMDEVFEGSGATKCS